MSYKEKQILFFILLLFSISIKAERLYIVKKGDSLYSIAKKYRVSVADLLLVNKLSLDTVLKPGDKIKIPKRRKIKRYIVRRGDSLWKIAKRFGLTVEDLKRYNRICNSCRLKPGSILEIPQLPPYRLKKRYEGYRIKWKIKKSGKRVKGGVKHRVLRGQSLKVIARAYGVSVDKIKEANPGVKNYPRVGSWLFIPGVKKVRGVPTPVCPKPVKFRRVGKKEIIKVRLLNCFGRVRQSARRIISRLARDRRTHHYKLLHPRLFILLQKVADNWPGHIIEIVSGYRDPKPGHRSNHYVGRAIDFRVSGVPNEKLRDFLLQFKNVGVGYYPNSVFVHLDVRDKNAYWVDISKPGEPPHYVKNYPR